MIDDAQFLLGLGGVAAVITALVTAYISLSKRKPETARVFIESAGELVVTQSTVLRETTEAYNAMTKRVDQLEKRSREQDAIHEVAAAEIEDLHRELSSMHDEMAALVRSRDQARADLESAKVEVNRLRARVQLLENALRAQSLPVPKDDTDLTNKEPE